MSDVPLASAQVIWNAPDNPELPPVKIVDIPGNDDRRYFASWGACNADFQEASDDDKLRMLFLKFHQLVVLDGVQPGAVHEAFMSIPEYRRALSDFGSIPPVEDEE